MAGLTLPFVFMIKIKYYEFWPFERDFYTPLIIEAPKVRMPERLNEDQYQISFIRDIAYFYGCSLRPFADPIIHPTLESATARERGCEVKIIDGRPYYRERAGQNEMKYCLLQTYQANNVAFSYYGDRLHKYEFISKERSINYFNEHGVSYHLIIPQKRPSPDYDGTLCRECKAPFHMGEPDGVVNDGMLTCYLCRDRLKSYKQWPYSKEKIQLLEEKAFENE